MVGLDAAGKTTVPWIQPLGPVGMRPKPLKRWRRKFGWHPNSELGESLHEKC